MRTGVRQPESFIPQIERCQITVRTKFHIYPMLSDMDISSVGYQLGYSLAVGVVHSLHHPDLLGYFSSPFLGRLCLTLFNHNLLQRPSVLGQKIYQKSHYFNYSIIFIPPFPKTCRAKAP